MKKETKIKILKIIIILSIIGIITSLYLVNEHYTLPKGDSPCDINESVSCSFLNTSKYSELFNVPVALFGALWFLIFLILSWKSLKREGSLPTIMLGWSIIGMLFVIYFITIEILLKTLCPLCTLVHIIIVITFILALILYKAQETKPSKKILFKALKKWALFIIILNLIPIILFNVFSPQEENYDELAQCLTEKGVKMYSSSSCSVCTKTKNIFGDSFQYIKEIECNPKEKNNQRELCIEKGVHGFPTWILEPNEVEQKRQAGFLSIDDLKEFAEC